MAERIVLFDINSLLKLMTHYSSGEIPLDSEIINFAISPRLPRYVSLMVRSEDWPLEDTLWEHVPSELHPYHFRYEGHRTMKWTQQNETPTWTEENAIEAPKRQ